MPNQNLATNGASSSQLSVTYRSIDELIPYAQNARQHSQKQLRKLQRSLTKFGWTNPLLVDSQGNLICGHGRLEAARLNGETRVPVIDLGAVPRQHLWHRFEVVI